METFSPQEEIKSLRSQKKPARAIRVSMRVVVLFFLLLVAVAVLPWVKDYLNKDEVVQKEEEVQKLLAEVSEVSIVPNETPVVFVVSDVDALIKQQAFFVDAVENDRLLVFPKTGKAIIYSPSRGVIVNMGPVTFDAEAANNQTQDFAEEPTTLMEGEVDALINDTSDTQVTP